MPVEFEALASCDIAARGLAVVEDRPGLRWSYEDRRRGNDSIYIRQIWLLAPSDLEFEGYGT